MTPFYIKFYESDRNLSEVSAVIKQSPSNLLGSITSSPNGNISELLSPRCTGCLDENHSSP
jgi:predicted transcriptional regulator with HTH domain